jgi:hypothetical protein
MGGVHLHWASYQQTDTNVKASVEFAEMNGAAVALSLFDADRPEESEDLAIGCGGWASGNTVRYWSGRHCVQVESHSGAASRELAAAIAGGMIAYGPPSASTLELRVPGVEPVAPVESSGIARFVDVAGLDSPAEVERYTDDLYEKINGREPQFRAYYFVELRFGRYLDVAKKETYDAYIFDMAEPANAFGIYAKERSDAAASVDLGRDGYQSGTATFFCKGKYYVYVLGPADGGDAAAAKSKRVAEAIAGTIAGEDEPFWVESILPVEDRVANSLSYDATSALSYKFLEEIFLAKYRTNDESYDMFLTRAQDSSKIEAMFGQLADQLEESRYDEVVSHKEIDGGEMLVCDSLGYFLVAFRTGVYMGGVIECEDQELAERQAEMLRKRLVPATQDGGEDG